MLCGVSNSSYAYPTRICDTRKVAGFSTDDATEGVPRVVELREEETIEEEEAEEEELCEGRARVLEERVFCEAPLATSDENDVPAERPWDIRSEV